MFEVIRPNRFYCCVELDSPPKCKTNASSADYQWRNGDKLLLFCTIDYTGNWSPNMEWSRNDIVNVTLNFKTIQQHTSITSTLTLSLKSDDNGVTFTCKSAIDQRNEIHETRYTYVPTYIFAWNFTANVLCEYLLAPKILKSTVQFASSTS